MKANTKISNAKVTFDKDEHGWYASNVEGSRASNAMVSGAPEFLESIAQGRTHVEVVFSGDVEDPGEYIAKGTRIEHDPWGATYRISDGNAGTAPRFRGLLGLPVLWLCSQVHRLGENFDHPKTLYIHSITIA